MQLTLEVVNGPDSGRSVTVQPGTVLKVGRTRTAGFAISGDTFMSGVHFELECGQSECQVRDLGSSNGTHVNGVRVTQAVFHDADEISAGSTKFRVRLEPEAHSAESPALARPEEPADTSKLNPVQQQVLKILREQPEPLFALLDAARDDAILDLLCDSKELFQSLYEGKEGEDLANFAPYLVALPKESNLLVKLVEKGWGESWGVHLTCGSKFQEVRKHFRHFLLIQLPDTEQVYFRFYDPRVLRVFLPTCSPEDVTEFFGPVQSYLIEDEDPKKCFRFVNRAGEEERIVIDLNTAKLSPVKPKPKTDTLLTSATVDKTS